MLIGPIQRLRGVAALLVVIDHALLYAQRFQPDFVRFEHLAHILGRSGVGIFFVISGFIMYHTSKDLYGSSSGAKDFILKRLIRILPMYYIATILALGFKFAPTSADKADVTIKIPELIASFLFFPFSSTDPATLGKIYPILAQGWTLNYEMFFYTLFAVTLLFSRRVGLLLISTILIAIALVGFALAQGHIDQLGALATPVMFWTHPIILLFLCGVLIGWIKEKFALRSFALNLDPIVLCIGLVIFACVIAGFPPIAESVVVEGVVLAAVFTAIVALCALPTKASHYRALAPLDPLGDASYSIYLFHNFAIGIVGQIWIRVIGKSAPWAFIAVCLVAASVGGYLAFRLLERPLVKITRRALLWRPTGSIKADGGAAN